MYFSHYCTEEFNELHHDRFDSFRYGKRGTRTVRAAPRGYAKSTFAALIEPIHDICYGLENFIVFLSNTEPQAVAKLADVRSELLSNSKLVDDYGINFPTKKPAATKFSVFCQESETHLQAVGSGTEIRGIRYRENRPSKIIVDDYEHTEKSQNETLRDKAEDYYFSVVSNVGNKYTNIEVIGTILHKQGLLSKLMTNPAYNGKLYKAVISWSDHQDLWDKWTKIYTDLDNDDRFEDAQTFHMKHQAEMLKGTEVLWPESESYLYLMKELIEKGKRAFEKEKQNNPLGADDKVFEQFHWYKETEEGLLVESSGVLIPWDEFDEKSYGVIDPATGQTKPKQGKLGDFSCILTGLQDGKGRLFVHRDWTKRRPPTKYIDQIFEYHNQYNFVKFGVETNLYRNLLLPNIIEERKKREKKHHKSINISFYDIVQVENKQKRIYTIEPKVTHGWILFNRSLSKTCMNMIEEFPHADHDDAPDALEMLWGLVHNRYKPSPLNKSAIGGR